MSARTFVYQTLINNEALRSILGGDNPRVFAKKTMTSLVEDTPYIVYKLGNSTDMGVAEDTPVDNQFFQVWVHDFHDAETADYLRIDEVCRLVREAFFLRGSGADGVWVAEYLETSQDLNDDTLNTVFRYLRFRMVKKEITS